MNSATLNTLTSFSKDKPETKSEIIDTLKRKNLYWISQASGWSLYVIVNLLVISSFETIPFNRITLWVLLGFYGIIFSHLYRLYIKKNNWTNLPLKKIIPLVLIASLVVGTIIYIPVYFSGQLLEVERHSKNIIATSIAGILNISSTILVWNLIYFAIHYFENSKKAEIETLIFEAAVKDFELKTLKAQLNPHFMFNAMNSIRALIEEDPQNAKDAITKLSNLMRYTLKIERTETVPLAEELKTIQDYLDLEKIRFEERLNYNIKSTTEADRVEIPPMMVQTLVENGIKHGISKITIGGKVDVDAKIIHSNLIIEIRNSGKFDEEALKNSHGFGVSNTKHRLALLYGENASLSLTNENSNIVLTKLKIPSGG
ncbi:MAG: histidine kinase [Ignavibacteriales bacterium]|nr:histidine kinase [Ignavibacteriales bacterium]